MSCCTEAVQGWHAQAAAPCPWNSRVGADVIDAVLYADSVRKVQLEVEGRVGLVVNVHSHARVGVGVVRGARAAKQREPLLGDDVRQ